MEPTVESETEQERRPDPEKARGRTFPCEGCGADFVFNVGVQDLRCPYCGFVKRIETDPEAVVAEQDYEAMVARLAGLREKEPQGEQEFREIDCSSCNATVRFAGTLTSSECAYCGSPLQVDTAHDAADRVPVDGVLPFLIDRKQAASNLREWVRSRWFAPNKFRKRGVQGKFNGIYLPYWTFDAMTGTRYSGMRGTHYYVTVGSGKNRRRVRRTSWTPVSGAFQRFFDDVMVVAAEDLPKKRVEALEPWPLDRTRPFAPELLAGFLARTYDVPLDDGFTRARARMDAALRDEAKRRIGGDAQRITSIKSTYDALTYKHLLLPLWMMAYRFKEKIYQVVVNAGTGEVQGDRPYSWLKITLAALAGAALIAIIALIASR